MKTNIYGNIHVENDQDLIPDTHTVVYGERLQPLCRKLGIEFAPAVNWAGSGKWIRAAVVGVVISKTQVDALDDLISDRQAKADVKAEKAKAKAQKIALARLALIEAEWATMSAAERSAAGNSRKQLRQIAGVM